ncbi:MULTISPECIES: hypothetical protein [unclassified Microbacterium]|uniref:hypothetical protein n=1 Tax=unclassified Microbacterium TaxID=2609290 RepID=UPI0036632BA5
MNSAEPLWIVVLVGALSGVIGAVVGPIMQRVFGRNDRAIDARQEWVRQKLQTVFGIGDEWVSSDGPQVAFMRLVPPHGATAHHYDMHSINWAVQESVDLMMLQPRRSAWARQWIYDWHFTLQHEFNILHSWMHYTRDHETWMNDEYLQADRAYQRRVRRVQSALSIWGTGQWLTHPSWRMRLSTSRLGSKIRGRKMLAQRLAPAEVLDHSYPRNCDCGAKGLAAWSEIRKAEAKWRKENPATD